MNEPVFPKPSSTVAVFRDGEAAPEVMLVRRRAGDAFGNSYAFPGGVVDHDESNAHGHVCGRTAADANRVLGVDSEGLDYYSAAVRELFEETGILLAREADGSWADVTDARQRLRVEVDKGRLRWSAFLEAEDLNIACDALHYFAWWQTPDDQPKRWSTRFFLAPLPPGQDASHDDSEITDIRWLPAAEAAAAGRSHSMRMPMPTIRNLEDLAAFGSVTELADWAGRRQQEGIARLQPMLVDYQGRRKWVVWGDEGYPYDEPR